MIFAPGSMLEKIGPDGFCGSGIENIIIPKNVSEIQERAFENCQSLKKVIFEKGNRLMTVGDSIFRGCKSLVEICLPEGLKSIEKYAFLGCESLKGIQLPDGL